jgi:hypothetical protein
MYQTYNIGPTESPISLEVKVGTTAVTYSVVSLMKKGEQDSTQLAESAKDDNGNIASVAVGKAAELQEAYLFIKIIQNFAHVPEGERPNAVNNSVIKYTLNAGSDGTKIFLPKASDKHPTPDNLIVSYTSIISLK